MICAIKKKKERKKQGRWARAAILNRLDWENHTNKVTFRLGPLRGEGISQEEMWKKAIHARRGTALTQPSHKAVSIS